MSGPCLSSNVGIRVCFVLIFCSITVQDDPASELHADVWQCCRCRCTFDNCLLQAQVCRAAGHPLQLCCLFLGEDFLQVVISNTPDRDLATCYVLLLLLLLLPPPPPLLLLLLLLSLKDLAS